MRFFLVCLIFVGIAIDASAMVGTGGYSPFGPTTQKDGDGGRNTFSFHPTFVLNGAYPLFHGHVFAPQLGLVLHRDQYDENSKTTILIDVQASDSSARSHTA